MPNDLARDNRHNLSLNCIHEFSWGFAIAFNTTYAIIPYFLEGLGAPRGVVISVAGLFSILIAIPQFLSAILGRNIRNIKAAVIGIHTLAWPPIFIMGFTFAFFAPTGPFAWVFYYICFILYGLSLGFIIPIWADFLHHMTHRASRGTFMGISFAFNSLGGLIGGFLVKVLLESSIPFPKNFGWGFFIMFASLVLGTLVYLGTRVAKPEEIRAHKSIRQFFTETKDIIRNHKNFRRYLVTRVFFTANFPAVSLYAIYTKEKFGFDISEAGVFTVLNVSSFGLASFLAGKIGDRYGHKIALGMAFLFHLLALITALSASSMLGVYGIFIFLGAGLGAFMPSSLNLVYEFAGSRDNKMYMALIDTFLAPFTLLAITLAGSLGETVSTSTLLISISIFLFAGLVLLTFWVKDPQHFPHEPPIQTAL